MDYTNSLDNMWADCNVLLQTMNGAKPQPLICVQQYKAMFRLYWVASHGATKSYLAWREQQQPRAAQVVHTHQTLSQHGWLRGFGTLNYSPCSWIFTFVSVVSSPLSYLFSSTTSRILVSVHITPLYGTKPILKSAQHSFTLSQKSRHHKRSCVWTQALSGIIFVLEQKLSAIVST